jgi:hypothetical protein
VIDGRQANCNLASLGRAQHTVPLGTYSLLLCTLLVFFFASAFRNYYVKLFHVGKLNTLDCWCRSAVINELS